MTTALNGHGEGETNEFAAYSPPDLSNFNDRGELVTTQVPGAASDAEYFAYSTILAEGLKPQSDTEIEFIKTAALKDPMQQVCLDKLVSWFQFVYNAPVCNRYGLIEVTEKRVQEIVDDAEDETDEDERAGMLVDIAAANVLAEDYNREKATATHLMGLPTTGMTRWEIDQRRQLWKTTQNNMEQADEEATRLYSGAREIYHHGLYILWVKSWIAADERQGLSVAQYDYTELKKGLRERRFKVFDVASRMPMAWQKAYQMCQISQSTGEEWRQMFTITITRGIGQMPPPEPKSRRWWQRIGRRSPDQDTMRNQQVQGIR